MVFVWLLIVGGVKSTAGVNINLDSKVITVSTESLNQAEVSVGSGYTLALGDDVTRTTSAAAHFELNGTNAVYKSAGVTAGYKLSDNKIIYMSAVPESNLFTVSGVRSVDGLSLNGNVVTVSSGSLTDMNVNISGNYVLALGNGVGGSTEVAAHFELNGSNAIYKSASMTAGYTISSDSKSIIYDSGIAASEVFTVSGVKSLSGLSLGKNVVTVSSDSLNNMNVSITGNYTLALAKGIDKPKTSEAHFVLDGSSAVYKSSSVSAGYKMSADCKSIVYTKAAAETDLFTVNGVKSVAGLSVNDKTVTVNESALNKTEVTVSNNYKLALDSGVAAAEVVPAHFEMYGSAALFKSEGSTAGYKLDNNKIIYTAAVNSSTLCVVKGVKSVDGLSLNDNIVTVSSAALNETNVTINEGYVLTLGNDVTAPVVTDAHFVMTGMVATYKSASTTEGYKLVGNQIVYVAAGEEADLFKVTGVKSVEGLTVSDKVVNVSAAALNGMNVSISDGYTLALNNDVAVPEVTAAHFELNGTTATYKSASTTEGYKLVGNEIIYTAATLETDLFSITGVKSTEGISVNGNVVTISSSSLNNTNVTISDGYMLSLASDVIVSKVVSAHFVLSDTVAIYKSSSSTAGYTVVDNKVIYVAAGEEIDLFMVTGVRSVDGLYVKRPAAEPCNRSLLYCWRIHLQRLLCFDYRFVTCGRRHNLKRLHIVAHCFERC